MTFFVGNPSAPARFGEDVANVGDKQGLFLKVFGGEVFGAFSEQVITQGRHFTQSIPFGKSAQFPRTWKVSAEYHSAGQELLGQTTDETERLISIDGLLVSHIDIYDLDTAMSHFEIRSRYSFEMGRALARVYDQNVFRSILKTAFDADLLNGFQTTSPFPAGQQITSSDVSGTIAATGVGSQWVEVMRQMRIGATDDNIPDGDPLYLAVPPSTFDSLRWATVGDDPAGAFFFNDVRLMFGQADGASGSVGTQVQLDGVQALRSNLIPQSNETADASVRAKYRADFSSILGVGWHTDAVGTVELIGVGMEVARDARRIGDFMVAKVACGHGAVRNEGAWSVTP